MTDEGAHPIGLCEQVVGQFYRISPGRMSPAFNFPGDGQSKRPYRIR